MVKAAIKTSTCLIILHCVISTGLTLPVSTEFPDSIQHHDAHVTTARAIHNNNYTQEITTLTTEGVLIDVTRGLENTERSHDSLDINTDHINTAVLGFQPYTTRNSLESSEDIGSVKSHTQDSDLESDQVIESFLQQTTDSYLKSDDDIGSFHTTEHILESGITPINEITMGSKQDKMSTDSDTTMAHLTIGTVLTTSEQPIETTDATTENYSGSHEEGEFSVESITTLAAYRTFEVSGGRRSLLELLSSQTDLMTKSSLTISSAVDLIDATTVSPPSNFTLSKHRLTVCRRLAYTLEGDVLFVFEDLFGRYNIDALARKSNKPTIPQWVFQKLETAKDSSVVKECLQTVYDILYGYGSDMRDFKDDESLDYVRDTYCSLRKSIRQLIHPNSTGDCSNHHAHSAYERKDSVATAETLAALYRLTKQIKTALNCVQIKIIA